jgi:uncharacterized membrane protein YeaQ/YmgE (transglycosylase-associated protein family)
VLTTQTRASMVGNFRHVPGKIGSIRGKVMEILIFIIVGAIAGWLAGLVVRGRGYGLLGDIIIGIIGALIASWLLPRLGVSFGIGIVAQIIEAFIGAVILSIILRLLRR